MDNFGVTLTSNILYGSHQGSYFPLTPGDAEAFDIFKSII